MLNEGYHIHNFISSSGSGTVINYGSGSDCFTSYGSGSGSTRQKVTVPTVPVPVPQHCPMVILKGQQREIFFSQSKLSTEGLHIRISFSFLCCRNFAPLERSQENSYLIGWNGQKTSHGTVPWKCISKKYACLWSFMHRHFYSQPALLNHFLLWQLLWIQAERERCLNCLFCGGVCLTYLGTGSSGVRGCSLYSHQRA